MKNYRFQITLDSDSVFVSRSQDGRKSRVTLSNLDEDALNQLAKSISDSELQEPFQKALEKASPETENHKKLYAFYLGLESPLQMKDKNNLTKILTTFSPSYTLLQADGVFNEGSEHTTIIHIGLVSEELAHKCAERLRVAFEQEAVGLVCLGSYTRVLG